MNSGRLISILFLIFIAFSAFAANKKAKVITESGKKWDVLFIKMSQDTIYLKVRKSNSAYFNISGHKSKFQKIEFADGSLLDFSLSDFPPKESKIKIKEAATGSANRDTVFLTAPSVQQNIQDTASLSSKLNIESFSQLPAQTKTDTIPAMQSVSDTAGQGQSLGNAVEKPVLDTEAMISIETDPINAMVKIDGREVEGTTPLVAKHLVKGEHIVLAYKDSLQASKNVSLANGEMGRIVLTLEKLQPAHAAIGKRKGRGIAVSLLLLSVASFAGSAGSYYLYNRDHPKETKTFEELNNSVVKGSRAEALILENKAQHDKAQTKLTISNILLGAGALFLVTGIVFYF